MIFMIRIKILGGGCAECRQLHDMVKEVLEDMDLLGQVSLDWTNNHREITAYGVMMTPGLVINGLVRSVGEVPAAEEIRGWLEPLATGHFV